jgi:hypothetical protein
MLDFIRRPIPQGLGIVEKSVPVLFFGNIETAKCATISINPSNLEFNDKKNNLLPANKKRFMDRENLGIGSNDTLTQEQAEKVYNSLVNYFRERPYKLWFDWLNRFFDGTSISYYKGSLIHLDITPWATSKKWGDMTNTEREKIIKAGEGWAKKILDAGQIEYLYVNGKAALEYVEKYIARFEKSKMLQLQKKCFIKTGKYNHCTIIGWSNNLTRAMTSEDRLKLRAKIFHLGELT